MKSVEIWLLWHCLLARIRIDEWWAIPDHVVVSPFSFLNSVPASLLYGKEFRYLTEHNSIAALLIRTSDWEVHCLHLV